MTGLRGDCELIEATRNSHGVGDDLRDHKFDLICQLLEAPCPEQLLGEMPGTGDCARPGEHLKAGPAQAIHEGPLIGHVNRRRRPVE